MKNQIPQFNLIFLSTLVAVMIWLASPSVKGNVNTQLTSTTHQSLALKEYQASYQISWYGMEAGISHHKLSKRSNGEYRVESRTEPKVKMLPFNYVETSDFTVQSNQIVPINYAYNIHEGKRHKKGFVAFDWQNKTVSNRELKEPWHATLYDGVQTKLTQTLCLRQALLKNEKISQYTVAEEDKYKEYNFVIIGTEKLKTELGMMDTVKMEHRSKRGYRTTMWLAKDLDYTPVKMVQYRNGKIAAEGLILTYKIG